MIALDLTDRRWIRFVEGAPAATAFHHPSWAGLVADCYGYRAFALAKADADGRLVAGLPVVEVRSPLGRRRWGSLPFTDECRPLTSPGADRIGLVDELEAARRRSGVSRLEIRAGLEGAGVRRGQVGVVHVLGLGSDPDAIWRTALRSSVRTMIRRAEREGVVVRDSDSRSALSEVFYSLHLRTRRRLGVPIQPRRFFELLWERLIEPGLGFVLLAYAGDTPVAGAVFLTWNGTVTYKYGASDTAFWHLRPNHLVMWSAIRRACEHGADAFDFGRSDLGGEGLRRFKASWGAEELPLDYSVLGGGAVRSAGRVQGAAGAVIRHSPLWVCQALGELLYQYAA